MKTLEEKAEEYRRSMWGQTTSYCQKSFDLDEAQGMCKEDFKEGYRQAVADLKDKWPSGPEILKDVGEYFDTLDNTLREEVIFATCRWLHAKLFEEGAE